ncbi:unnamed protein product [Amoebophrya sp. A25]|nr:unnamed protein product [Amoebophrya sp. A25]|eukprot:GSA25T00025173001.1
MREFVEFCLRQARLRDLYDDDDDIDEQEPVGEQASLLAKSRSFGAAVGARFYERGCNRTVWFGQNFEFILRSLLVSGPLYIVDHVPHASSLLSLSFLYTFAQAVGLTFSLGLTWLSVLLQTIARCFKEGNGTCLLQKPEAVISSRAQETAAEIESYTFVDWISICLSFYVYYACTRMLLLVGYGLYSISWESFAYFPTVRKTVSLSMQELSERYEVKIMYRRSRTARKRSNRGYASPSSQYGSGADESGGDRKPYGLDESSAVSSRVVSRSPPTPPTVSAEMRANDSRTTRGVSVHHGEDKGKALNSDDRDDSPRDMLSPRDKANGRTVVGSPRTPFDAATGFNKVLKVPEFRLAHVEEPSPGAPLGQQQERLPSNVSLLSSLREEVLPSPGARQVRDSAFGPGSADAEPPSARQSKSPEEMKLARRRQRGRRALLFLPLIGLFVLSSWLAFTSWVYELQRLSRQWVDDGLDGPPVPSFPGAPGASSGWLSETVAQPTGRLNRCFRFLIFLSLLQWAAQYLMMFPNLFTALATTRYSTALFSSYSLLAAAGGVRLVEWILFPVGTNKAAGYTVFFNLFPHHVWDASLVTLYILWMLVSLLALFSDKKALLLTGFDAERFSDDDMWRKHIALFKFNFIIPMGLHFLRGAFFSRNLGFKHAVTDSLVVALFYPLLLLLIWTVTFVLVVAFRRASTKQSAASVGAMLLAGLLAYWICYHVVHIQDWIPVALLSAHCCRQVLRLQARVLYYIYHNKAASWWPYTTWQQQGKGEQSSSSTSTILLPPKKFAEDGQKIMETKSAALIRKKLSGGGSSSNLRRRFGGAPGSGNAGDVGSSGDESSNFPSRVVSRLDDQFPQSSSPVVASPVLPPVSSPLTGFTIQKAGSPVFAIGSALQPFRDNLASSSDNSPKQSPERDELVADGLVGVRNTLLNTNGSSKLTQRASSGKDLDKTRSTAKLSSTNGGGNSTLSRRGSTSSVTPGPESPLNPMRQRRSATMQYIVDGYGKVLIVIAACYLAMCTMLAFLGEMQRMYSFYPSIIGAKVSEQRSIPFAYHSEDEKSAEDSKYLIVDHVVSQLQVKLRNQTGLTGGFRGTGNEQKFSALDMSPLMLSKNNLAALRSDHAGETSMASAPSIASAMSEENSNPEPENEFRSQNPFWAVPRYATCGQLFHGLSLLDYSLVAQSAYMDTAEARQEFLDVAFPPQWYTGKRAGLRPQIRFHAFAKTRSASWVEIYFPELEQTLVAIKGTDPLKLLDYFEDLRIWRDTVLVTLLANVFPTIRVWPKSTTEMVIRAQHEFLGRLGLRESTWAFDDLLKRYNPSSRFFRGSDQNSTSSGVDTSTEEDARGTSDTEILQEEEQVEEQRSSWWSRLSSSKRSTKTSGRGMKANKDTDSDGTSKSTTSRSKNTGGTSHEKVVFVGHSMGGGIASILGFLNRSPVVAFQPPGIYHSIAKFQHIKGDAKAYDFVHHDVLNVVVESDWINRIFDEHGGLLQQIGCDYPQRNMYLSCHVLEGVFNHLFKSCGDERGRFEYSEWKYELIKQSLWDGAKKSLADFFVSSRFYSYFVQLTSFRYTLITLLLGLLVRLI